jgi:hypothetical protein
MSLRDALHLLLCLLFLFLHAVSAQRPHRLNNPGPLLTLSLDGDTYVLGIPRGVLRQLLAALYEIAFGDEPAEGGGVACWHGVGEVPARGVKGFVCNAHVCGGWLWWILIMKMLDSRTEKKSGGESVLLAG